MKKFLSLLLVIVSVLTLAACKKSTTTTAPKSSTGAGTTQPGDVDLGVNPFFQNKTAEQWKSEYTDIIDIDEDGNGTPDWQEREMTITWGGAFFANENEYNNFHRSLLKWAEQYPNITIERDERWLLGIGDHYALLDLYVSASQEGTMPDIFFSPTIAEFYDQGLTLDLTPYLHTDEEARYLSDSSLEYIESFDGEEMTGLVVMTNPLVPVVNTGLLRELNIDIPNTNWTYEEYEALRDEVGAITESGDVCKFPGKFDFSIGGAGYFDNMPGGFLGFNTETLRYEFENAPKWGEWNLEFVNEVDRGWHFYDLSVEEQTRLCDNLAWPWGDGFDAVGSLWLGDNNWMPRDLRGMRQMEYEIYPLPEAPEGGRTQLQGWFDTFSLSYELEDNPVKAQAAFEALKWFAYGEDGLSWYYTLWEQDVETWGWNVDDYVNNKGGDAANFPVVHPSLWMNDYLLGWPTTNNPNVLSKHPMVVGFPEDSPYNIYNFEVYKDPYFQDQLSNQQPNIRKDIPGISRGWGDFFSWAIMQEMRDLGFSFEDVAPKYSEQMNEKMEGYLQNYNNVE